WALLGRSRSLKILMIVSHNSPKSSDFPDARKALADVLMCSVGPIVMFSKKFTPLIGFLAKFWLRKSGFYWVLVQPTV
ncbi:hypothetical protein ABK046_47340, partial [Streptomyces caeruleatus]